MNRLIILALGATVAAYGTYVSRAVDPPVDLQPTTPGTVQTGNANISGKLIASTFYATNTSSTAQMFSGQATSPTGLTYGGLFRASSDQGTGIRGYASASTGATVGGDFQVDSTGGTATRGISTATSGTTYGGFFRSSSTTGYGVYGNSNANTGVNYGGYFINSSGSGTGVFGRNSAAAGNTYGGSFAVNSPTGTAVFAVCTAGTGIGYGGQFQVSSATGFGLYANVNGTAAGDNAGVYGRTSGATGHGVRGIASASTDQNFGGWFEARGDAARGVYGWASKTTTQNVGGYFESASTTGRGVIGNCTAASGVNYGVRGVDGNASGFAVYGAGNMGTSGTKAFRIDHPLDPENKYLNHYSAEGPEPLNVYTGTIVTDGKGYAWVQLPDYYSEINKDPRYQLTVVSGGEEFVQAMVSREITGNRFQVRTSKPGVKVCWEVKATRNDAWVRKYGAPVEVDKVDGEKGLYQHPELYGKPQEKGMDYVEPQRKEKAPPSTSRR